MYDKFLIQPHPLAPSPKGEGGKSLSFGEGFRVRYNNAFSQQDLCRAPEYSVNKKESVFICKFVSMKKIAVLTSGGDAPGMNACIRAVVRTAIFHKLEVTGITRGYDGMIHNEFIPLNAKSVANIIQRGGTILKTSRSAEFLKPEGRKRAQENLERNGIEGVVAIGGDGTFKGALELSKTCPDRKSTRLNSSH